MDEVVWAGETCYTTGASGCDLCGKGILVSGDNAFLSQQNWEIYGAEENYSPEVAASVFNGISYNWLWAELFLK